MTPEGDEVPLQVKSSQSGCEIAKKKHPDIPVIVAVAGEKPTDLGDRILQCLKNNKN